MPELFAQKPEGKTPNDSWWEQGLRAPRIKALKAAIKMIEDENS